MLLHERIDVRTRPLAIAKVALAALSLLLASACERDRAPEAATPAPKPASSAAALPAGADGADPLRSPPAPRIVAIGDLHGDLSAARRALRLAGAIDGADHWIGKDLTVVQTGDQIDRGDDDRAIVDLFDGLAEQAKAAGGAVIPLNGNHEIMNVALDFRYVTAGGFKAFTSEKAPEKPESARALAGQSEAAKGRASAFLPGGSYAEKLARRHVTWIVGDTVFVHGGILPKHVRYGLGKMDREVSDWMKGSRATAPNMVVAEDGIVWVRRYSAAPEAADCKILEEALDMLGAKRMVVGHTVQRNGINEACSGKVWRIDVGMSSFYGGKPEVLEIRGAEVRVLRETSP